MKSNWNTVMLRKPDLTEKHSSRLVFIDGLRGVAVALVVVFHAAIWGGVAMNGSASKLLALGRSGVDLFLVLSGFCLFWPLIKNGNGSVKSLYVRQYIQKRANRIFPPYYAAIILVLTCSYFAYRLSGPSWWKQPFQNVFPWDQIDSSKDILAHLLLLHGFSNNYAHSLDGAFWSLSLEWQFYFLLIPLVWLARKTSVTFALLLPVVICLIFRVTIKVLDPQILSTYVGNEISISRWVEFAAGMCAAVVLSGYQPSAIHKPKYIQCISAFITNFFYLLLSVGVAIIMELFRDNFFLAPFVWANACFSLIVYSTRKPNLIRSFLEWRPLVNLGSVSYSLYLVHGSVFMIMASCLSQSLVSVQTRQAIFLFFGPVIATSFALLFYNFFEKPFLSAFSEKKNLSQVRTLS